LLFSPVFFPPILSWILLSLNVLDTEEQERAAINEEQKRQNGWISQLAKATNTKLVPEQ
jgi:hypothetical protein